MNPRLTVVMPAYQAEQTIGAAVSSVLQQTFADWELVVVDDGSTDATNAIAAAHPGPVRVVRQDNAGVAAARNRGIAEARGKLIAFCDADDILLPRHLEALHATWERSGGIATSNCYWLFPGGIDTSKTRYRGGFPRPERQRRAILEQNFVLTMSLFPRSLVDEIGPFDPERRRAEDWDFWLRAVYAGYRVALQPEPLALYRWGAEGLSSDWRAMDADVEAIFTTLEDRVELEPAELEYVRRRRGSPGPRQLSRDGDAALRRGDYRNAARAYGEAAALAPSERMLLWKARLMKPAPQLTGPLLRRRQLRIEHRLGIADEHIR